MTVWMMACWRGYSCKAIGNTFRRIGWQAIGSEHCQGVTPQGVSNDVTPQGVGNDMTPQGVSNDSVLAVRLMACTQPCTAMPRGVRMHTQSDELRAESAEACLLHVARRAM
jgi:hypothetical protein